MRTHQAGVLVALLLAAASALALNRCVDASGKVNYSDKPCAGAEQQTRIKIQDNKGFNAERRPSRQLEGAATPMRDRAVQSVSPNGGQVGAGAQVGAASITATPGPECSNAMRTYDTQATTRIKANLIDTEISRKAAEEACGKRVPKMREQIIAEDEEEKRRLREAVLLFCSINRDDYRCRR